MREDGSYRRVSSRSQHQLAAFGADGGFRGGAILVFRRLDF